MTDVNDNAKLHAASALKFARHDQAMNNGPIADWLRYYRIRSVHLDQLFDAAGLEQADDFQHIEDDDLDEWIAKTEMKYLEIKRLRRGYKRSRDLSLMDPEACENRKLAGIRYEFPRRIPGPYHHSVDATMTALIPIASPLSLKPSPTQSPTTATAAPVAETEAAAPPPPAAPAAAAAAAAATQSLQPEQEMCAVCFKTLPTIIRYRDHTKIIRLSCCGQQLHKTCDNSDHTKQKLKCALCGDTYQEGSKEELKRLNVWVDKGHDWAYAMLGDKYFEGGYGLKQSYQKAAEALAVAAEKGHAPAQDKLGSMYFHGQGVTQSFLRSVEYHTQAAAQGYAEAQYALGLMWVKGQALGHKLETTSASSNEKARVLWVKAAAQGHKLAMKALHHLDEQEGKTTLPESARLCSTCSCPETFMIKLNSCPCKGAQYCNSICQKKHWKAHKKVHRALLLKETK